MDNIILHVDMDAFFASVEQMDNPKLKGKPVIVGGISSRGVVSTCSYEARKYGVHSAMPLFLAKAKCPNGIYLPVRFDRYKEVSSRVFSILNEITDLIEPLSIDEAYLDLSGGSFISGIEAAKYIKKRVFEDLGLTISVGISYNKFLAKLGSDWNKPDGIMEITRDMVPQILLPLKINKIYGIGKKSVQRLNSMGIFTVEDLMMLPKEFCSMYLGKNGEEIYERIRGNDKRNIVVSRERKSYGKETTLKYDTDNKEEMLRYIDSFSSKVSAFLNRNNLSFKTITLKYKTASFINHTRSKTFFSYKSTKEEIYNSSVELLKIEEFTEKIRLIGITVSGFSEHEEQQLRFI